MPRTICIILGRLCSGKGRYFETNFDDTTFTQIVVSDVVRGIVGKHDRASLQDTASLDMEIIEQLADYISEFDHVVIDGIRQPSILEALEEIFDEDTFLYTWIEVADEIRKQRFETRGDAKDKGITFEQADQKDVALGLNDVKTLMYQPSRYPRFKMLDQHFNTYYANEIRSNSSVSKS